MLPKSISLGVISKSCAAIFFIGSAALLWGLVTGHLNQVSHWIALIVLILAATGLLRLTAWSRILASCVLWFASFIWVLECTPMPVEGIHSILEPVFGDPLPVWAYVTSVIFGIMILLLPVWFFSKHRFAFHRKLW